MEALHLLLLCVVTQGGEALCGFLPHQLHRGPNSAGAVRHPQDPGRYRALLFLVLGVLGLRLKSTLCSDPTVVPSETLGGDFRGGHRLEAEQTQRLFGHH